jgi:hypothetical protein
VLSLLIASALFRLNESDLYRHELVRQQPTYHLVAELRIYSKRTGKLLAKKKVSPGALAYWSPSGRALATFEGANLLVWNEKDGFRTHSTELSNGGEEPWYELTSVWSPDERFVFIRIPETQGAMILEVGTLLIVDVSTGKKWEVAPGVLSARWVGDSTLEHVEKTFFELPQKPLIEKKVWRPPKQR